MKLRQLVLVCAALMLAARVCSAQMTDAQREQIVTRAIDWLYFDDWGRAKTAQDVEAPDSANHDGPLSIRNDPEEMRAKSRSVVVTNGHDKAVSYRFDMSHRTLKRAALAKKASPDIRVYISPNPTGGWQVQVAFEPSRASRIIITTDKDSAVVQEYPGDIIYL